MRSPDDPHDHLPDLRSYSVHSDSLGVLEGSPLGWSGAGSGMGRIHRTHDGADRVVILFCMSIIESMREL